MISMTKIADYQMWSWNKKWNIAIIVHVMFLWQLVFGEEITEEYKWNGYMEAYQWPLPDCDPPGAGPVEDFTLVTALIDLDRGDWPHFKRGLDYYLTHAVPLLNMNVPLVIYVDESYKDFIRFMRKRKRHLTFVQVTNITQLELYAFHDRMANIMRSEEFKKNHSLLVHPEGFSADYNILMNSKQSLLYRASRSNPFHTSHFYWIDLSYGHGENVYPASCTWAPRRIMDGTDKIYHIMLNDIECLTSVHDLFKSDLPPFLSGGFFGGSKVAVARYYFLHRRVFRELLSENIVDDDQTLAVACYFKLSPVFALVEGWWHDAFTLFSEEQKRKSSAFKIPYAFY